MPADLKVILLAVLNACLITGGVGFQKLNAIRGGNPFFSGWIVGAFICLAPTFFIGNIAFVIGGRMSVFIPVISIHYVLIALMGHWLFDEGLAPQQVLGLGLIVAGVALITSR